jgi:hypothetical protein
MQEAYPSPIALSAPAKTQTNRLRFTDTLHSTFAVFARQPVLLIGVALVCFGAGMVIGGLVYAAQLWDAAVQGTAYFTNTMPAYYLQMQVQAVIGTFTFLAGRGMITWLALQDKPATLRAALSAALGKWKPLLASTLIYGLIISIAMVGLIWLLREFRLDPSNYRWFRNSPQGILTLATVRSLAQVPPDPGSPFTELYATTRYNLARNAFGYLTWNGSGFRPFYTGVDMNYALPGLAGVVLLVLAEAVLCLRTAAVMAGKDTSVLGWVPRMLAPLRRHFWRVLLWRWGVRVALAGVAAACLVLPMALQQSVIASNVIREVRSYWPYLFHNTVQAAGTALIVSLSLAFSLVFEARLFAALQEEAKV